MAKQYYGQCSNTDSMEFDAIRAQLNAFTDMEVMAQTMADPAKFMKLMTVVNDPRTLHVMSSCGTCKLAKVRQLQYSALQLSNT